MLSKAHPAAIASLSLFCLLPLLLPTPQIDLFGEISGISFTPLGEELFVGVADLTYSSMLQAKVSGLELLAHYQGTVALPSLAACLVMNLASPRYTSQ
eukprot:516691-Pelagomonas_calceolata.AAC.4